MATYNISTIKDLEEAIKLLEKCDKSINGFTNEVGNIINAELPTTRSDFQMAADWTETDNVRTKNDPGMSVTDKDNPPIVSAMRSATGWEINATGTDTFFLEFGTGVYYNGIEPYPESRPADIVGIGKYGKGYGNRKMWAYRKDGLKFLTRGNYAFMPMYKTKQRINTKILQLWSRLLKK